IIYLQTLICVSLLPPLGPYCNRTWDGWLCWGDSSPGTAVQNCPNYFQDFDPAGEPLEITKAILLSLLTLSWGASLDQERQGDHRPHLWCCGSETCNTTD
uniref:G-protein coupled receptors family 2 profile 1 domain-containing protein n=1 Tax=Astyanax mexicanus TaxID=7994 RepID=A0A3B1KH76_ASTMX